MRERAAINALRKGQTVKLRKTTQDRIVDIIVYVSVAIVFLVCFYPFYLAVVLAFNQGLDAQLGGIYLCPKVRNTAK